MNYIYDIVLNYFDNYYEFYEWSKDDNIIEVNKIPIFRINRFVMDDLLNNKIRVDSNFLNSIYDERIGYCCLFCDLNVVISFKFDKDGYVIGRSSLLFDEEESIIDEVCDYDEYSFSYEIVSSIYKDTFLTRKEISIRDYLINEINKLYKDSSYDFINYLYGEIYNDRLSIKKKYEKLIFELTNNYNCNFEKLYDICILVNKKEASSLSS